MTGTREGARIACPRRKVMMMGRPMIAFLAVIGAIVALAIMFR